MVYCYPAGILIPFSGAGMLNRTLNQLYPINLQGLLKVATTIAAVVKKRFSQCVG